MADTEPTNVYFVGTAGAGKSTLTGAFKEWALNRGLDAIIVNLDPGAEKLPYTPDVDVRDWVNLRQIMTQEGLGPNGAQIAASDLLALQANKIRDAIEAFRTNYVLIDTPGQIELFVFRPSGKYIVDFLGPEKSVLGFLVDPFISKTPSGFVSALMLAASVQLRLGLPTAHLLTKSDMLQDEERDRLIAWSQDPDLIQAAFESEEPNLYREMNIDLYRVLGSLGASPQLYPTSAINLEGLEDLYAHIQQVVAGGEDILSD